MQQRERKNLSLFLFVRIAQLHPRNAIESIGGKNNTPNPSAKHTRVQREPAARGVWVLAEVANFRIPRNHRASDEQNNNHDTEFHVTS